MLAALANPARHIRKVFATEAALREIALPDDCPLTVAANDDLQRLVPPDAPHQGLVLEADPLPSPHLADALAHPSASRPLVFLDQITDPHNVGAIIRSAAAFGAAAIVTQDRHSPPESGALARAASGALEILPWVRVTNLARALGEAADAGFWRIGLAGEATLDLEAALPAGPVAIVIGAEGDGLRRNSREHCDALARLPISRNVESLNASNAAAVALYAISIRK